MLVRITGDVPPTPPPRTPTDPQMTGLQAEKDIIIARTSPSRTPTPSRHNSRRGSNPRAPAPRDLSRVQAYSAAMTEKIQAAQQEAIDGVRLKTPPAPAFESGGGGDGSSTEGASSNHHHHNLKSPSSSSSSPRPVISVVTADESTLADQHGAITRKFYSKLEPPISITQYLARLHQFCPMSTAVYLATAIYIRRLAVEQRAIPVTRRNVHRLVLAGLRVATKALEDLAYPHTKMARVGGVSESELARLEISFCFLAGFELVMSEEQLREHWEALRDGVVGEGDGEVPELKLQGPKGIPTPDERTPADEREMEG